MRCLSLMDHMRSQRYTSSNAAATAKDIYEYYFANDKTKKTLEKNNKSVTETSVGTAGD